MSNRVIKFRGYCHKVGEWRYGYYAANGGVHGIITPLKNIGLHASQIDPDSLGQFTGLTDKNGVEIYEGDVYHQGDKNIRYVVTWSGCQFLGKQISNESQAGIMHWIDKIEVIGNLYEHKNLLNK